MFKNTTPKRVRKFQILPGDKIHLGVVPKLGSSAIRNLYTKDTSHTEQTHELVDIDQIDGKIIVFLKEISSAWYSGIYTDFQASVLNPIFLPTVRMPKEFPLFPHWIGALPKEKIIKYFNYLITHNHSVVKAKLNGGHEWREFEKFYKIILFNAFHLSRDLTWLYTGHASDIMKSLSKTIFDDRFIFTSIHNINNSHFLNWLQENDPNGWKHLDIKKILSTKKSFSIINITDNGNPNSFNVKPPDFVKNIISYIDTLDDKFGYFRFNDTIGIDQSGYNWEVSTIPYLNLWRIESYKEKIEDIQFLLTQLVYNQLDDDRFLKFPIDV